ncbi:ABC transporter permease [Aurantiacibacter suaedae]|uniref:ABC transporter permease n=1 Tax=Aurantiacibacter suaedae TaxID=2545755 RepID=UPI0010F5786B|nr:ABC transporter permease [Aurantiacibacter suaedae]
MSTERQPGGRLPLLKAAYVVARRDFTAILFSRAFIFFLLGPLFPVVVMALAGGVGAQVQQNAGVASIGFAMSADDNQAMLAAGNALAERLGEAVPPMSELRAVAPGEPFDAEVALQESEGQLAAVVTGTPAAPHLTATEGSIERWQGIVSMIAAQAEGQSLAYPEVATSEVASSAAARNSARINTAQGGQVLLFLLIMLLASMVLSNLVEEKGNKIIEVLAAAIPMDALFLGKLFAMLAVSVVGIAVWGTTAGIVLTAGGVSLSDYAMPGVGWPIFMALFALYFAMGYLLLGAIFLTIGSQAKTVREVQTLSMPATMLQVLVFFLSSLTITNAGGWIDWLGMAFPLSSPFVMVAHAAMDERLWPHALALGWQALCVAVFVRVGASMFRKRVMKSGPQAPIKTKERRRGPLGFVRGLFSKGSAAAR